MTQDDIRYEHLIGVPFVFGKNDCLSLFRQFYKENFGIEIRNYARPENWSADQLDLMRLCYEREGFEMITDWKTKDLRTGDVLCVAIGEETANHFAIYTGNGTIVHHLYGRFSSEDPFRDFWRNHTCFLLRHPDVPDLRPVYPDTDIVSLLNARNSASPR